MDSPHVDFDFGFRANGQDTSDTCRIQCSGFRGVGVSPAIFLLSMRCKNADGTPAPQHNPCSFFALLAASESVARNPN
jgi:hypothetical protein